MKDFEERVIISKEARGDMIGALQEFFRKEREEELGHLAAEFLLRCVLREIGPAVYNQGVRDAARYMLARVEDLAEIELY